MSYEGYSQFLCEQGHYWTLDCWADPTVCPQCKSKVVWENAVNITNGSEDEKGNRIDGYVELKKKSQRECKHCGSILEIRYYKPRR